MAKPMSLRSGYDEKTRATPETGMALAKMAEENLWRMNINQKPSLPDGPA